MSYEKSEPGRVAPVIPGRHGPALIGKHDNYYLIVNNKLWKKFSHKSAMYWAAYSAE